VERCYHFRRSMLEKRQLPSPPVVPLIIQRQQRSLGSALKTLEMTPTGQLWTPCKAMSPTSWHHISNPTASVSIFPTSYAFGRLTVGLSTNHWNSAVGCEDITHGSGFIMSLPTVLASSSHVMLGFSGSSNLLSGEQYSGTLWIIPWSS